MEHRGPRPAPPRRGRTVVLVGLAALGIAVGSSAVPWSLVAPAPSSSSAEVDPSTGDPPTGGDADGRIPDGVAVSVFAEGIPAVDKLDPALLDALRRSASEARADGIELLVNSGWRSPEHQQQLLEDAILEHGSREEAARWVATAETSAHVSGEAVDIGPHAAAAWLSEHGAAHGLCQTYGNEPWHFELRPDAIDHGCPPRYADPTDDPRMQP